MDPLEFRSRLAVAPATAWTDATTLATINDELWPLVRLTAPFTRLDDPRIRPGAVIGTAWMWLGGILPAERMRLRLAELDLEGRRFVEQSELLSLRTWRHEREVTPVDGGCELSDTLDAVPRIPGTGPVVRAFVRQLFTHRHRRLRARYGTLP